MRPNTNPFEVTVSLLSLGYNGKELAEIIGKGPNLDTFALLNDNAVDDRWNDRWEKAQKQVKSSPYTHTSNSH